jgi:epoxyqueuosine reductase
MAGKPMSNQVNDRLTSWLRQAAIDAGFMLVGVAPASLDAAVGDGLDRFLQGRFEGDMGWLRATAQRRQQPRHMWDAAQSAIVLAMNYGPDHDPMDNLAATQAGNISVYARGRDYHDVIKGKLKQLAGQFASRTGKAVKVFVDTAPLMEKPLAQKAGLGWQGKHTNLVSRTAGSWLFLGVILTDAILAYDQPETDHCGSCQKCLDICPTAAFPAPYRLDARRCISYLTIEHKGVIPGVFRAAIGNRIFGCDDCLAVCPWNKYAQRATELKLAAQAASRLPQLADLLRLDDAGFRQQFANTPVRRAGYERFIRNVLIAAGNSADPGLGQLVVARLDDNSPLIRGMAVWAARQLLVTDEWMRLKAQYLSGETDLAVIAEWQG